MKILEESDYWESIAHDWKIGRPDLLWRKHSDAINQSLLLRWLPHRPVPRLLKTDAFDEAVGEGLVGFLQGHAHSVYGIDLSLTNLQLAGRVEAGLYRTCTDVRQLPFASESFDIVVSNSTLDHFHKLEEISASLEELHRVLRREGQLILTLDNLANPVIAIRNHLPFKLLSRLGILPYFVGTTCGPWHLKKMLREAGFAVQEVAAVLHCPRIVAVLAAKLLSVYTKPSAQQYFLNWLKKFEVLSRWPSRYFTGYFIAVRAEKGQGAQFGVQND